MGIGICDECIKKYYPRKTNGMILGSWTCAKCGTWGARGYYGRELDDFEKRYREFVTWLPKHRKTMKRKGVRR